ncbi:MAG: DUF2125 domain-containing protein [Pseudomonadota bacterium]
MRKALLVLVGLVVLVVGGWAGAWFMGKPTAEAAITATLADMRAQGISTTYDDLSIVGFPHSYEGRFTNLTATVEEQGTTLAFPTASGAVSITDTDTLVLTFPEKFQISQSEEGRTSTMDVISDGLTAAFTQLGDDALGYKVAAASLSLDPKDTNAQSYGVFSYTNPQIDGTLSRNRASNDGTIDLAFTADRLNTTAIVPMASPEGEPVTAPMQIGADQLTGAIKGDASALRVTLDASELQTNQQGPVDAVTKIGGLDLDLAVTPKDRFDMDQLIAAQNAGNFFDALSLVLYEAVKNGGTFDIAVNTGPAEYTMGASPQLPFQRLDMTSASSATKINVTANTLSLTADASTLAVAAQTPDGPRAGALDRSKMDIRYPLQASPEVQTATISYDLADITLEDSTWAAIDPDGALPREMRGLQLDVGLDVVMLQDLLTPPGQDLPIADGAPMEFKSVTLNKVLLDMLGLEATAGGALDLSAGDPQGTIDINLKNWRPFFDNLARTQVIDPTYVSIAQVSVASVVEPGPSPDVSVIKLDFRDGNMFVNGKPFTNAN